MAKRPSRWQGGYGVGPIGNKIEGVLYEIGGEYLGSGELALKLIDAARLYVAERDSYDSKPKPGDTNAALKRLATELRKHRRILNREVGQDVLSRLAAAVGNEPIERATPRAFLKDCANELSLAEAARRAVLIENCTHRSRDQNTARKFFVYRLSLLWQDAGNAVTFGVTDSKSRKPGRDYDMTPWTAFVNAVATAIESNKQTHSRALWEWESRAVAKYTTDIGT